MAISRESLAILKTLQALINKVDGIAATLKSMGQRLDKIEKQTSNDKQ